MHQPCHQGLQGAGGRNKRDTTPDPGRQGPASGFFRFDVKMKPSPPLIGAVLTLLAAECADAAQFARAVSGKGYLAVPVGTVDRPKKKTDKRDAFVQELQNREFFYAADGERSCE